MSEVVAYAQVKQSKDKQLTLVPRILDDAGQPALDGLGAELKVNLAADDVAEMQIRESVSGIVFETLSSLGDDPDIYVFPENGTVPEHIVVTFRGEKTRMWELTALRGATQPIPLITAGEEVPLPRQKLYGTLLLRDVYGLDRVCSGVDIPIEMEVSLTRGAVYEPPTGDELEEANA